MAGRFIATDLIRSATCTSSNSRARPADMRLRWLACGLALAIAAAAPAWSQDSNSPDTALEQVLKEARASCAQPADRLSRVLCGGRIRIGVREFYPLFATRGGDMRSGDE